MKNFTWLCAAQPFVSRSVRAVRALAAPHGRSNSSGLQDRRDSRVLRSWASAIGRHRVVARAARRRKNVGLDLFCSRGAGAAGARETPASCGSVNGTPCVSKKGHARRARYDVAIGDPFFFFFWHHLPTRTGCSPAKVAGLLAPVALSNSLESMAAKAILRCGTLRVMMMKRIKRR